LRTASIKAVRLEFFKYSCEFAVRATSSRNHGIHDFLPSPRSDGGLIDSPKAKYTEAVGTAAGMGTTRVSALDLAASEP